MTVLSRSVDVLAVILFFTMGILWYPFWWIRDLYRAATWDHIDYEVSEDPPQVGPALWAATVVAIGTMYPCIMTHLGGHAWESVVIVAIALVFYVVITRERDKE